VNLRKDQLYDIHKPNHNDNWLKSKGFGVGTLAARSTDSVGFVSFLTLVFSNPDFFFKEINITLQLLAMDVSAQATMKDAAKCDKHFEWQNSENK
jgi:hypothetical protein